MPIYYSDAMWLEPMDRLERQFQVSARVTDRPSQGQNSGTQHANQPVAGGSSQAARRATVATASIGPSSGSTSSRVMNQAHAPPQNQTKAQKQAEKREERRTMLDQVQQYLNLGGDYGWDVVFVCIDVEALELPPKSVTEVGIAILDTQYWRDDYNAWGCDWIQYMECHHMRIEEYAHHTNYRYIEGCPDRFNFGESTFHRNADVAWDIETLLRPYTACGRRVVFVGHDAGNDIEYLKKVNFDVLRMEGLWGQCDTKDMHRAWKGVNTIQSLESILREFSIGYDNLHNAGNDAVYTLCAMIGIAIRDFEDKRRA